MELGAFSMSLAVKDLAASREFYEKLGFKVFHDQQSHNWLILKCGTCTLGLFQGMFENNMLTFNPGWDDQAQPLDHYTDVREIQQALQAAGVPLEAEADPESAGPASCLVIDPDGNPVLIDQHV